MTQPDLVNIVLEELILNDEEIKEVVDVWYETSIRCHDFISESYWYSNREVMTKLYIPSSQTRIAKCNDKIVGFISLVGNTLASIFVHPDYQYLGIGRLLLQSVFLERNELQLNVYGKNTGAISFYIKHGFSEVATGIDESTGEPALTMRWYSKRKFRK